MEKTIAVTTAPLPVVKTQRSANVVTLDAPNQVEQIFCASRTTDF